MRKQASDPIARNIVVVVDDDPAVCNSLKFSLELEGFAVHIHARGSDLLESADVGLGRCFVIDQKMADMTGLDLIGRLRARQVKTPAILITTHPGPTVREQAARAHVPIVEKPLLTNTLIDQIHQACARDRNSHQRDDPMVSKLISFLPAVLIALSVSFSWAQEQREIEQRGKSLLTTNCSRCHAIERTGNSPHPEAPPFRTLGHRYPIDSLAEALAEGLVTGHPDMPEFVFESEDVGAILAYLNSIQEPGAKR